MGILTSLPGWMQLTLVGILAILAFVYLFGPRRWEL